MSYEIFIYGIEVFDMDQEFRLFSLPHIIIILSLFFIVFLMIALRTSISNQRVVLILRFTLAISIFLVEGLKQLLDLSKGTWSIKWSLPFHLCGITSILCIIMLLTQDSRLFDIIYYWALVGSPIAVIIPGDLNYTYADPRLWLFMASHFLNVIIAVFMMIAYKYRPFVKSIRKVFIETNIYMVLIAGFNYITGSDYYYFYLSRDPAPQLMNPFKGINSWFIIILLLEAVTLLALLLYYSPFAVKDHMKDKRSNLLKEISV